MKNSRKEDLSTEVKRAVVVVVVVLYVASK